MSSKLTHLWLPYNFWETSDQGLHCLFTGISIKNKMKKKSTPDTPKFGNGLVQLIRIGQLGSYGLNQKTVLSTLIESFVCGLVRPKKVCLL